MITIQIKTDNAAFEDGDNGRTEVARILRDLADKCEGVHAQTCLPAGVYDVHGNRVGEIRLTGKDRNRCTTRVIFRRWLGKDGGDITAILLDVAANPGCVVCYAHVGQHGEGHYPVVMAQTRPATAEEYAPLYRELTGRGYDLIVRKRRNIRGLHHTDTYGRGQRVG